MSDLTITETHMRLRGAQAPAQILEERLGGRLLVAAPGKANRWLVLDRAPVPAGLAKRLPEGMRASGERVIAPAERLEEAVSLVESWVLDGTEAKDARRAAAARKAADTRASNAAERKAGQAREAALRDASAAAAIASGVVGFDARRGLLSVRTPYDERVVAAMRGIRGSRWDGDARTWTVPAAAHEALAPLVPRLNAWAAEREEARAMRQAPRPPEPRHVPARPVKPRRLFPLDQAPRVGATVRWGDAVVTVEGHGKAFRGDEDTSSLHGLAGMEGEPVCYVYHREATPAEEEALAAREARAAVARAVSAAALAVMREPGETVVLGHEPEGEVVWEDARHALHGTRDWAVLDDEGWLWRCEYRGADGDAWGECELGWNVRGSRVRATPERLAALAADAERTGFEPRPTRAEGPSGP